MSVLHHDRNRAESFGQAAALYDRARPGYPDELLDVLLSEGARHVLDVGCGTGIAARQLTGRGCQVLGVEPDERMAEVARGHGVTVEVGPFEDWDDRGRRFDLMTAAQAWHWIDPDRGAAKAAGVLRPGGQAALFWNRGRFEPDDRALLDPIYTRLAPDLEAYSIVLGNRVDDRFELAAAGLRRAGFAAVSRRSFPWQATYTTEGWLEHLQTHSDHRGLPPETLDRLLGEVGAVIDRRGGALRLDYETWLVSGRAP